MQLPTGWTSQKHTHNGGDFVEIIAPSGQFSCSATVDLKRRTFRAGYSFIGHPATNKIYKRHGWRDRLIADAVAHLKVAIEKAG